MMTYGTIHYTRKDTGLGQVDISYRFEGDVFLFGRTFLPEGINKPGQRFSLDGAPFVVVDIDPLTGAIIAARDTNPFWTTYWLIYFPITKTFRLIYRRFIMTLAIWNLAEVQMGEIPTFECISRKWRRLR